MSLAGTSTSRTRVARALIALTATVTALVAVPLAGITGTATATAAPALAVAPESGPSGTSVAVQLSGFGAGEHVQVTLHGNDATALQAVGDYADDAGNLAVELVVPPLVQPFHGGPVVVRASGPTGREATGVFTVTSQGLTLGRASGPSGSTIEATAARFLPERPVLFQLLDDRGEPIAYAHALTDGAGTASALLTVPDVQHTFSHGDHAVVALDPEHGHSATAVFEVTRQTLSLDRNQGPSGSEVVATAAGFHPGHVLQFELLGDEGNAVEFHHAETDAAGTAAVTITVPTVQHGFSHGDKHVVVRDPANLQSAAANFVVSDQAISLDRESGPSGSDFVATASGFLPGSTVEFELLADDGSAIAFHPSPVAPDGTATGTFTVPTLSSSFNEGPHVVAVSDLPRERTAMTTFAVTTQSITLNRSSGASGSSLVVNGFEFTPGATARVSFVDDDGSELGFFPGPVGPDGRFIANVTVPSPSSTFGPGPRVIVARESGPDRVAAALFTVEGATDPQVVADRSSGPGHSAVNAIGSGFPPNETIFVTDFDGTHLEPVTADAGGVFRAALTVPPVGSDDRSQAWFQARFQALSTNIVRHVHFLRDAPSVVASAVSGNGGTIVQIDARGLNVGDGVITQDFELNTTAPTPVGPSGHFTTTMTVPPSGHDDRRTERFRATLFAAGANLQRSVPFLRQRPDLLTQPSTGVGGTTTLLSASGFGRQEAISVTDFEGNISAPRPADDAGRFAANADVPGPGDADHFDQPFRALVQGLDSGIRRPALFLREAPAVTSTPAAGPGGTTVTLIGGGFKAGESIGVIGFGDEIVDPVPANHQGRFTLPLPTPVTANDDPVADRFGAIVFGLDSTVRRAVTFLRRPALASVSPTIGEAGTAVTIRASGFVPGEQLHIQRFDGSIVEPTSAVADADGAIAVPSAIPDGLGAGFARGYVEGIASGVVRRLAVYRTVADTVPPTITGSASPAPNGFGWNAGPVLVEFSCDDTGSGVASCAADTLLETEGAGQSVTGTATDNAGNSSETTVGPIDIDLTPPTLNGSATTDPNPAGWYRDDVTIDWTATDGLSGIDPSTEPAASTITGEGAALTASTWVADKAGHRTTASSPSVRIDRTPPAISGAPTTAPNSAGWYRSSVTVDFSCSDALSGVVTCGPQAVLADDGVDQSASGDAVDAAGNAASTRVGGIRIDSRAPATDATLDCLGGWCTGASSTVQLRAADQAGLSGVESIRYRLEGGTWTTVAGASADALVTFGLGSGSQVLEFQATDVAGNVEALRSVTVSWDNVAPSLTATATPAANADGWNNGPVRVHFDAEDDTDGSGLAFVTPDVDVTGEPGAEVVGEARDTAGNRSTLTVPVRIDQTAPSISGAPTSAAGPTGWYRGPVTVAFACTDALSGVRSCSPDALVNQQGTGLSVTGAAVDRADNEATSTVGGINIDSIAPEVEILGVVEGETFDAGAAPTPTCTASDGGSGLTGPCTLTITGGTATGVGAFTATATATDVAGNTTTKSVHYTVAYRFDGFHAPITAPGHNRSATPSFKAGSTVPVKFVLTDVTGAVVASASPRWLQPSGGNLTSGSPGGFLDDPAPSSTVIPFVDGEYHHDWKTSSTQVGRYWRIGFVADDGVYRTVVVALT